MIICAECGRDIDAIGQDNMSHSPNFALCEDCAAVGVHGDRFPDNSYSFVAQYHAVDES